MKKCGLLIAVCLIAAGATVAVAQRIGSEGQIVSFNAALIPPRLPRDRLAPIKIRVEGEFKATARNHLAQLTSMEVAINRHGQLFTAGLPVCGIQRLVAASAKDALASCGPALIGHGRIRTKNFFPEQPSFVFRASILAFNARGQNGGTQFLVQVHAEKPLPFTLVVPVAVRRTTRGAFGTILFARMPGIARRWAYLTRFKFTLGRQFLSYGNENSLLSASCPAPQGLDSIAFPFARAKYRFLTTRTINTILIGDCQVSDETTE
jgi:hypothetical protein